MLIQEVKVKRSVDEISLLKRMHGNVSILVTWLFCTRSSFSLGGFTMCTVTSHSYMCECSFFASLRHVSASGLRANPQPLETSKCNGV